MLRSLLKYPDSTPAHLLITALAVLITALMSLWWQQDYWVDLNPPVCATRLLVQGENPYSACYTYYYDLPSAPYPLTTFLAFLPFMLIPSDPAAIAMIWASMNGVLIYGLLKHRKPWLFLIFLSPPYWAAFVYHQFSPLIAGVYLLPQLLPLALLKPQIGLPVILQKLNFRRLIAILAFIGLSFVFYPTWLVEWFGAGKNYDGVIPLLVFPLNLLFLIGAFKFRDQRVQFVLLMACVPQRAIYDLTALYLLPKNLRQMLVLCLVGWLSFLPYFTANYWKVPVKEVPLSIIFFYLPLLLILVFWPEGESQTGGAPGIQAI